MNLSADLAHYLTTVWLDPFRHQRAGLRLAWRRSERLAAGSIETAMWVVEWQSIQEVVRVRRLVFSLPQERNLAQWIRHDLRTGVLRGGPNSSLFFRLP